MNKILKQTNGLSPLSVEEEYRTKGGSFLALFLIAAGSAAVKAIIDDWDNFKNGLTGKPEEK